MTVYTRGTACYIMSVPSGYVKVGHSGDPDKRRTQLQAEFYEPITLCGHTLISAGSPVAGYEMEQLIHRKLRNFATHRREWFAVDVGTAIDAWHMAFAFLASPTNSRRADGFVPAWLRERRQAERLEARKA